MSNSLNNLEIYRESMRLADDVWALVCTWDGFAKSTVGNQLCRAIDSISANIAEGHGRYHFKENQKFCFYARGSLTESQTWLEKSATRNLINKDIARELYRELESLHKRLNAYINSIGAKSATND